MGSTVFGAADFAKITESYTRRSLTIAELFQLRSAIAQLYLDNGYITSGAFIPPQVLQRGVVTIRVVEGKLATIAITGTRRLKPNYVRSRLALAAGTPLNRDRLLEALQLLQLDPLIQSLSAELSAGSRPGESVLSVRVVEEPPLNAQLTFDNGRAPTVGTDRRQLQASFGNVTGLGDRLSAVYANTTGSNTIDLNYTVPVNPRNGTLSFNYGSASSNVIESPFDGLGIESKSRYYELTMRQPIAQTPTYEFAIGLTGTRRESEATIADGLFPFPAQGADRNGRTRLTALRFFQDMTWRSGVEVIALRSQFTLGLSALNATINPNPPDSRFFAWRGQAQWVRLLAPDTLLLLRGDVQLADRPLLPLEQFSLGGQDSVRGYRQDALLTDSGLFASAELRLPILRLPKLRSLLQLTPFIDLGTAWNLGTNPNPDPRTLAAVGLGLRLQWGDRITARLDWGIPLISIGGPKNTWQENGVYFSIVVNPF
jgi:hemolysin activation/secretion protein